MTEKLAGELTRFVYKKDDGGWGVARIETDDGDQETVVGPVCQLVPGASFVFHGEWKNDSRFGRQFKVQFYESRQPTSLEGIKKVLASGMIPGVGPELAKRIVSQFGGDSLRVIEVEPERLRQVDGIGKATAQKIHDGWSAQAHMQGLMVFLQGHGVPMGVALRIQNEYGEKALQKVQENPYRLAFEVWGVGFRTADQLALKIGFEPTSPFRVEAGVIHALHQLASEGHTAPEYERVVDRAIRLISVDVDLVEGAIPALRKQNILHQEQDRVCLFSLWECERDAATLVRKLQGTPATKRFRKLGKDVETIEKEQALELAPEQRDALFALETEKVLVITGGPGVGKTTLVRSIVELAARQNMKTLLAAPTGRAAMRLMESTHTQAETIHRMLEYQPHENSFAKNRDNQLLCDILVVDEASMIDIELFFALIQAVPEGARLILVGDMDQLPAVGPGDVLSNIVESGLVQVVRLHTIFRQGQESEIVRSAHLVRQGAYPYWLSGESDQSESDLVFLERGEPQQLIATLLELVARRIPSKFKIDPVRDIQLLTPMHRGDLGTQRLNHELQLALNPDAVGGIRRGDRMFRPGDKVMQIKNDYERGVFNGDVGLVQSVDETTLKVIVVFQGDRVVVYERGHLDQLVHAYAISIHKSQGSEYPVVIVVLTNQHYVMLERNLLYTAITRGKKMVVVLGQRSAIKRAIDGEQTHVRQTLLTQFLQE